VSLTPEAGHSVQLGGQTLVLKGTQGREYLDALVEKVEGRITELALSREGATTLTLALLASLNLADEVAEAQTRNEELDRRLSRLADRLEGLCGKE
jgi:cell division protein ZapA (FtsZ GTPase activity inhibitor)